MFYKNFLNLCVKNNLKPNQVTKAIGLSNATATDWKKGSVPRDVTLRKLADYFGVSVDELLKDDTANAEENPAKGELSAMLDQMTPEQLKQVAEFVEFLISKRK